MLNTAIDILQGMVSVQEIESLLAEGHEICGTAWGYDEREIPWRVWLAANSTYHAVVEASGYQPLDHLPRYIKKGILTEWTDESLCQNVSGDTAAIAAMVSAFDEKGLVVNEGHLLEFWE